MSIARHLSYANITATAALVVALGGSAYAATKIGTNDIADGAVTSAKLANNAVTAGKIASSAVSARALAPNSVTPAAVSTANKFPISVNNATKLNGVVASQYLRAGMAQEVFNRTGETPQAIITIKDFGTLGIGCSSNGNGFARFTNKSGKPVVVSIASTSTALRSSTVQSGAAINGPTSNGPQMQTWRLHQGNSGSKLVGTAWIELVKGANKTCSGSIQALSAH